MTSGAASTSPARLAGMAGLCGIEGERAGLILSMEASCRGDLACAAPDRHITVEVSS